jgi:hypothetical protein
VEDLLGGQLPFLHHGPGSSGIAASHHSFVLHADLWEGISNADLQVRPCMSCCTCVLMFLTLLLRTPPAKCHSNFALRCHRWMHVQPLLGAHDGES